MYELKQGASRLIRVLEDYKDDKRVLQYLAHYLNYTPDQLYQDIQALSDFYNLTKDINTD